MCCFNKKLHWITITNNDICHRVEKVNQESVLWCKIICWIRSHINYVVAAYSKICRLNNFHVCYYFIWIIRFPSVWAQNSVEKACLINIQKNHGSFLWESNNLQNHWKNHFMYRIAFYELDIKISIILVKKGLAVSFSIEYKLSNYVERFIVHRLPLNIITCIFMCMHIEWLAKCNVSFLP